MIQTSDKVNAAGKSVRQMEDDEVRARLSRIAAYNRDFAGTHYVTTARELYDVMKNQWHVTPEDYGVQEPPPAPPWKPMKKGEVRQREGWLPGGEKMVVVQPKKGAAREI